MSAIRYDEAPNGGRAVTVRCPVCTSKFDALVQTQQRDGSWSPSVESAMNVQGWVEQRGMFFCGKLCAHKHAFAKKEELQTRSVTVLEDASYQRSRQATSRPSVEPRKGKPS